MHKRGLVLLLALAAALSSLPSSARTSDGHVGGASTPVLIDRAQSAGRVDKATATLYRAYAIAAPDRLPRAFRGDLPWRGTEVLLRIERDLPALPAAIHDRVSALIRPGRGRSGPGLGTCSTSLAPSTHIWETAHFYIEYSEAIVDHGPDGLAIADYANALEAAWAKEVAAFGWAAPPLTAPGNRYHVRIDVIEPIVYGYVAPTGEFAGGNNPNTPWDDMDAQKSCMVLNADYSLFALFGSSPRQALEATAAHEFNHSIQFGIGALDGRNVPDDVFVEGGATWVEDEVFDAADDSHNYLWPVFEDSMGEYDDSPYSYWITFRGFTERYGAGIPGGGEDIMQAFWEYTSKNDGSNADRGNLKAMAAAVQTKGTTLAAAFHAYAIAAAFVKDCGGGYVLPYCFEEATEYVETAGLPEVHGTLAAGGSFTGAIEDNYAINWISLPPSASSATLANTSSGGELRGSIVCDTGSALTITAMPAVVGAGGTTTIGGLSLTGCSRAIAVITNQSQTADNPGSSTTRSYRVTIA